MNCRNTRVKEVLDGKSGKLDYANNEIVSLGTGEFPSIDRYYSDSSTSPHSTGSLRMAQNRRCAGPIALAKKLENNCCHSWVCPGWTNVV